MSPRIANIEAERAAIGHCLVTPRLVPVLLGKLPPEAFADPACGAVRSALEALQRDGGTIDVVSVWSHLVASGESGPVGAIDALTAMTAHVNGEIDSKLELVATAARVRSVQSQASRFAAAGLEPGVLARADAYVGEFASVAHQASSQISRTATHVSTALGSAYKSILAQHRQAGVPACPTGMTAVDKLLRGGWRAKRVNVIAARPGDGKSAFALQAATAGARAGHPQRIFSLEMDVEELTKRQISQAAKLDYDLLESKDITHDEWVRAVRAGQELSTLPMWFDDDLFMWSEIEAQIEAWIHCEAAAAIDEFHQRCDEEGIQRPTIVPTAWVDYLQLCEGDESSSREREIAKMSRRAKKLAKRTSSSINLICQLNRVSDKEKRRPRKSDLRESGAIEQDANTITLLYRQPFDPDDPDRSDTTEAIVDKNRSGPTGIVELDWIGPQTRFEDQT